MTDLKPCPFCGRNVRISKSIAGVNEDFSIRYEFRVICSKCDVKIEGLIYSKSEEEITEWWNTRGKE